MKEIRLYKGDGLGRQAADDVTIVIADELPTTAAVALDEARRGYEQQADALMRGLRSLPQATRSALLLRSLEDAKVYYRGT